MKWLQKGLAMLLAATMLVVSMTACGSAANYKKQLQSIMQEISASDEASRNVNYQDETEAKTYVEDTKAIYQKLIDLKAPSEYKDAQEKIAQGATDMVAYLDALPTFLKLGETDGDYTSMRQKLLDQYSQAVSKIAEGTDSVGIVTGEDAATSSAGTTSSSAAGSAAQ